MFRTKPTSKSMYFTLTLSLLLGLFTSILSSEPTKNEGSDKDSEGIEELLLLDEEVEREEQKSNLRDSEAEVLSKAHRIVLELNSDINKKAIDENGFVLVLGYAPWCPRSAAVMPQFAEAAALLRELGSPF